MIKHFVTKANHLYAFSPTFKNGSILSSRGLCQLSLTANAWAFMKKHAQSICGIKLLTATISLSVELRVLSLCLVDLSKENPVPMVIAPPVCPIISGCTANNVSTYQLKTPIPLATVSVVTHASTKWQSLRQSSMSGPLTLVVRNAMLRDMSGFALLNPFCCDVVECFGSCLVKFHRILINFK